MGDLAKTVELVQNSWKIVLGAVDAETAGVILFRHIFTIAPEAKGLFSFAKGKQSDEDLYNNLYLKKHGANVVMTVNTAVAGLTDLDALVPVLKGLGKRHVGYGARRPRPRLSDRPRVTPRRRQPHTSPPPQVLPPHYDVVGQALIATLGDALGPQLTPEVKEAWLAVYGIVKDTMISDHYEAKA
ncbi:oxygen carrier [Aureococcus anophagefferens]|uniref:Oxygen carrier n=1 Tax=Aureococcus anophagefferens TaxID=44056 RepID=A0ABR1FXV8_AURAN